jgi:hypothetical protein
LTVIGTYSPVEGKEEENYAFYENHQKIINNVSESEGVALNG